MKCLIDAQNQEAYKRKKLAQMDAMKKSMNNNDDGESLDIQNESWNVFSWILMEFIAFTQFWFYSKRPNYAFIVNTLDEKMNVLSWVLKSKIGCHIIKAIWPSKGHIGVVSE